MYHPSGLFKDWAPSEWVNTLRMNSHFILRNGRLTVHNPGLYLVYAQVIITVKTSTKNNTQLICTY